MPTSIKIHPSRLTGTIKAPPSKSITHRAMIMGSLALPGSRIRNPLLSEDTLATKHGLEAMGARFESKKDTLIVTKSISRGANYIDCRNSGTTLRLLTAIASRFKEKTVLDGDVSLQKRPIGELIQSLQKVGVHTSDTNGCPPVTVQGPISIPNDKQKIEFEINGSKSSQFISALLLLGSCLPTDTEVTVTVTGTLRSRPYIDLTIQLLQKLALTPVSEPNPGQFCLISRHPFPPFTMTVDGDFSSAAFFLVAGALSGNDLTMTGLENSFLQADSAIIKFLKLAGAEVKVKGKVIRVKSGDLQGFTANLKDCPDLFPILSILGAFSRGRTILHGAEHLKFKESNRIKTMVTVLKKMGVEVTEQEDGCCNPHCIPVFWYICWSSSILCPWAIRKQLLHTP